MKYSDVMYARALVESLEAEPRHAERTARRFIELLRRTGDISRADGILRLVQQLTVERRGGRVVMVETARELSSEQVRLLRGQLKPEDELEQRVNPSVLGGMRVTIGDELMVDASLARKLRKLSTA